MAGKIITDQLERQFRAARSGLRLKTASSATVVPDKVLPSLKNSMVGRRPGRNHESHNAKYGFTAGGGGGASGADTITGSPEIRNPLLNLVNFYLPYDRKTLNQWIRYYDRFHPYIGNCLDIHGDFPISDFNFTGLEKDSKVQQLYEAFKEDYDLVQYAFEASREYELMGEVFTFSRWNDELGYFDNYTIINPDLLEVVNISWGSGNRAMYTYEPPQELLDLAKDADPRTEDLLDDLDDEVREAIMTGKQIPLDSFNIMALVRKASPYESRGTSVVIRIIKELMYEDKLREAQYAIADQQVTPVQLWKLGDTSAGYMPTETDLEDFRQIILAGRHDFNYVIVTHSAVNVDLIGFTGKLLPIIPELDWVAKRVLVGLFSNESMVTGEGPTYSNAIVALKVLQGRYQSKRDKMIKQWKTKLFEPMAKAHQLFDTSPAQLSHRIRTKRNLIIPDIEWDFKLDLTNDAQRIQYLIQLADKSRIPMQTICEVLNVDYDITKKALKQEEGTVFDPVYQAVRKKKAEDSDSGGVGGEDLGMGGGLEGGDIGGGDIGGGGLEGGDEGEPPMDEPAAEPEGGVPE